MILLLSLSLLMVIAFYNFYWKRRGLPPGPVPLPGIGNMHTYGRLASIAPHEAHRRWRQQYGPVYTYWVGEKSVVSIADYATMQETFVKDGDTYAGRYFFTEGLALLR
ncbi:Protein CYP-33D3, partial [Aphelenchoides avenae]